MMEFFTQSSSSSSSKTKTKSKKSANNRIWHGLLGNPEWELPVKVVDCDLDARPGYASVQAHEYEEDPQVLREKVQFLAHLLTQSKNCIVYTGAGISTSSGIGDYATKSKTKFSNQKLKSAFAAKPTLAHRVVVAMYKNGLVKKWIQQNHDGLPQKAGLPQHAINEIHGAWFDPTNPVVPMSGSLRTDLMDDLLHWEEQSDLTIAIGTSLCGMNADRVFTTVSEQVAKRERKRLQENQEWNPFPTFEDKSHQPMAIGGVIIGIQQTQYDSIASLRIFSRIDVVMSLLNDILNYPPVDMELNYLPSVPSENLIRDDVYRIPYDANGHRLKKRAGGEEDSDSGSGSCSHSSRMTILDLTIGSQVRMVSGPYEGDVGQVIEKTSNGHYKIQFSHTLDYRKNEIIGPYLMEHKLGSWWIEAAVNGTLQEIPLVNTVV